MAPEVLAFTFHRRQSLRRLPLDLDGSVASMQGSFSTRAESALGRQRRDRWRWGSWGWNWIEIQSGNTWNRDFGRVLAVFEGILDEPSKG